MIKLITQPPNIISTAPARICLYGDHQDYLGLPVITAAIDRKIELIAEPITGSYLEVIAPDINEKRIIPIQKSYADFSPSDHLKSSLHVVQQYGCNIDHGYRITITGDIPINAGLSSSSAIVVSWVQFLLYAFAPPELNIDGELIAKIAYESEVEIHGDPGGKMDQYAIGVGNVLYIDTGSSFEIERLYPTLPCLIIGESGIPKNTIGLLKKTKWGAIEAIASVKNKISDFQIKNAGEEDLPQLLPLVSAGQVPFLKAAIINHAVTRAAHSELKNTNPNAVILGNLMNRHHWALKELLGITLPLIDRMIDGALSAGALGAKIVGSGGGGCILAMANESAKEAVIESMLVSGAKNAYEVHVSNGATIRNQILNP